MFEVAGRPDGYTLPDGVGAGRRIALVDDHQLFSEAMAFALTQAHLFVVGMSRCDKQAIHLVRAERPDVVLLDLRLPDRHGIELGEQIIAMAPEVRLIGMSATQDRMTIRALRRAGFHGFVPKSARVASVVDAIRSKEAEAAWLTSPGSSNDDVDPWPRGLTPRERDVLALLVEGLSASAIGANLEISTNTARSHIQNILAKLHVRTRLEAVAVATRARD
jgi:two-component system nitrate/nitrite response regulator NarL